MFLKTLSNATVEISLGWAADIMQQEQGNVDREINARMFFLKRRHLIEIPKQLFTPGIVRMSRLNAQKQTKGMLLRESSIFFSNFREVL